MRLLQQNPEKSDGQVQPLYDFAPLTLAHRAR